MNDGEYYEEDNSLINGSGNDGFYTEFSASDSLEDELSKPLVSEPVGEETHNSQEEIYSGADSDEEVLPIIYMASSEEQTVMDQGSCGERFDSIDTKLEEIKASVDRPKFVSRFDSVESKLDYLRAASGNGAASNQGLVEIKETEQKIFGEIREMHKLYHTEFAGRLKSMSEQIEQYRKIESGRIYDDILGSFARVYSNNETLVDETDDPKLKKSIRYLLMDIEDILTDYGVTRYRSEVGEKRNPRFCQIIERIETTDPAKNDTVAKSYNSAFTMEKRPIIKEKIDVYYYVKEAVPDNSAYNIKETDGSQESDSTTTEEHTVEEQTNE